MILYVIDPANGFVRSDIIDEYESFIWTDRYDEAGDVKIVTLPTPSNMAKLKPDVLLGFDESDRVMRIESALREEDAEGRDVYTITGKSYEWVFEGRVAMKHLTPSPWVLSGTGGQVATQLVEDVCVRGSGVLRDDIIPNLSTTNLTATGPQYLFSVEPGTLYKRVQEICRSFDLGFRVTLVPGSNNLVYATYQGTDRTGADGVVFSKDLENLSSSAHLWSRENYKTGAYVYSKVSSALVDRDDVGNQDDIGFRRRIILVDATDVDIPAGADHDAALKQRGRDALAETKEISLYDGVVNPDGPTRYNKHYFMGDICSLVVDAKLPQKVRVTEHIWSHDSNGVSSYPTLSAIGGV